MDRFNELREQIADLQREQRDLSSVRRSRAEVAAHVKKTVERWGAEAAKTNRLDLGELAHGHALLGHVEVTLGVGNSPSFADVGPLLVLLLGAQKVSTALLAGIDSVPEGLPTEQRERRLAEISAELDRLEAGEERLILASEAAGAPVLRRADARPEIVLALAD